MIGEIFETFFNENKQQKLTIQNIENENWKNSVPNFFLPSSAVEQYEEKSSRNPLKFCGLHRVSTASSSI